MSTFAKSGVNALSVLADTSDIPDSRRGPVERTDARQATLKFAEAALADSKREGLLLAVRARWVALAVTAVTLPIINPTWDVLYYVAMLSLFAAIGWAQRAAVPKTAASSSAGQVNCQIAERFEPLWATAYSESPWTWTELRWRLTVPGSRPSQRDVTR